MVFRREDTLKATKCSAGSRPLDMGAPRSSRPLDKGGGGERSPKNFFQPFGPEVGLKIRRGVGPLPWLYVSVVVLSSMGFSIANASDVLHLNLRNWSAKNGKRTKWDNSTSFFTRVKPLLYFWIDYITTKTKNKLFRQNPAQTQGSVTISNKKKTSCNQELRIMNYSIPLGASYSSRIIQTFVE